MSSLNIPSKNAPHNPWNRWSEAEKASHLQLQSGSRPVKWTLDLEKVGTLTENGEVYTFAGGPLEGAVNGEPRKRADGKVDGRSKGVRKCGKCGQSGHNARTCTGKKAPASAPAPVVQEASPAVQSPSERAPEAPKSIAARDQARSEVRAARKVKGARVCGKCGQPGHNARTCGKGGKVRHSKAPTGKTGRQNICGKCKGLGHNARTCKG